MLDTDPPQVSRSLRGGARPRPHNRSHVPQDAISQRMLDMPRPAVHQAPQGSALRVERQSKTREERAILVAKGDSIWITKQMKTPSMGLTSSFELRTRLARYPARIESGLRAAKHAPNAVAFRLPWRPVRSL